MIRQTHIARVSGTLRRGCGAAFAAGVGSAVRGICGSVVRWMLAAAAALCCVACIYEFAEEPAPMSVRFLDGESIALQVSMFDIIEDRDDAHSDIERMHNLRVIITHRDADDHEVIEYNRLIEFGEGTGRFRYGYVDDARLMFKIEQGSAPNKHIYLFANSEPILNRMLSETEGLSSQPDPENGIYGGNHYNPVDQNTADIYLEALRNVTFTNRELQEFVTPTEGGAPNGLPMSAEYDIQFSPGNAGVPDVHILNAYIVRAANKITFEFMNDKPTAAIFVKNFGLSDLATSSYLLPRVGDNGTLYSGEPYNGDWIAWLAKHECDETGDGGNLIKVFSTPGQGYDDGGTVTYEEGSYLPGPMPMPEGTTSADSARYRWCPYDSTNVSSTKDSIGVGYDPVMDSLDNKERDRLLKFKESMTGGLDWPLYKGGLYLASVSKATTAGLHKHAETEPVYFLESNFHKPSTTLGKELEQSYTLYIDTETLDDESTMTSTLTQNEIELPNVKSLFRNTHVKITGTIGNSTILIKAAIKPWTRDTIRGGILQAE